MYTIVLLNNIVCSYEKDPDNMCLNKPKSPKPGKFFNLPEDKPVGKPNKKMLFIIILFQSQLEKLLHLWLQQNR